MTKKGSKAGKVKTTRIVQFVFDQETSGAWRLKEVAPEGATADEKMIGSLYLRKAQVPDKPAEVEVAITIKK